MAKVVIIDDDLSLGEILKQSFLIHGYMVELAKEGEEGLIKVKTIKPDIVLLDILMPKMNGLEVLDRLKNDPETKNIPVVIFTNLDDEKDAETALAKGAISYIPKDQYEPKQLVDVINQLLSRPT